MDEKMSSASQKRTKYPKEVGQVIRPTKQLMITSQLVLAKADEGDNPLQVYKDGLSRFVFTIRSAEGGHETQKIATANLPVNMVGDMLARSDFAFQKHMEVETAPIGETGNSVAYTAKFALGNNKGKTPVEVLIENGEQAIDGLRRDYAFLKDNSAKFHANKVLMKAIEEAVTLYKEGKLSGTSNVYKPVINVYDAEARSLIRKKRDDGMCPVYELHIQWDTGKPTAPVSVNIVNFYAPVKELEGGRINPQVSQKDASTYMSLTQNLAEWEWMNIVRSIRTNMLQFETMHCRGCITDADEADKANRSSQL